MYARLGLKILSVAAMIGWTQFVDVKPASANIIVIAKVDPRPVTDIRIEIRYDVEETDPEDHFDWETVLSSGTSWTTDRRLRLIESSATLDDDVWVGNFLRKHTTQPTTCNAFQGCLITIDKIDDREMTNIRIDAWFKVNGDWHHDSESAVWGMSGRCGVPRLELDGRGADFDEECDAPTGTGCWEGDMLYDAPGPVC